MKKSKLVSIFSTILIIAVTFAFFAFKKTSGERIGYSFEVETVSIQGAQGGNEKGRSNEIEESSVENVPLVEKKAIDAFFSEDGSFEVRIKTLTPENELYEQTKDFFQVNSSEEGSLSVGEVVVNNDGVTVFDVNGKEIERQKGDPAMAEQIANLFKGGMSINPDTFVEAALSEGAKLSEENEQYNVLTLLGEEGTQEIVLDKKTNLIISKKTTNLKGEIIALSSFISHREGNDIILETVGEEFYFTNEKGQRVANKLSSTFKNYTVKH